MRTEHIFVIRIKGEFLHVLNWFKLHALAPNSLPTEHSKAVSLFFFLFIYFFFFLSAYVVLYVPFVLTTIT